MIELVAGLSLVVHNVWTPICRQHSSCGLDGRRRSGAAYLLLPDALVCRLIGTFNTAGWYIVGGVLAFIAAFPIFHFVIGLMMIFSPGSLGGGQPPPAFLGWFFVLIAGAGMLFGWTLAVGMLLAGWFLKQRKL